MHEAPEISVAQRGEPFTAFRALSVFCVECRGEPVTPERGELYVEDGASKLADQVRILAYCTRRDSTQHSTVQYSSTPLSLVVLHQKQERIFFQNRKE